MNAAHDFWQASGHHLLDRDERGALVVTDEFLKVFLARPEITPPGDACRAERSLHTALLQHPRRPVTSLEIEAVADADARENWGLWIELRDHLVRHRTVEAAYLDIVRNAKKFPHLFLNQLVHLILRNALDNCDDVFVLRAAELFFRPQRLTLHDGSLVAADEETVSGLSNKPISPLLSMFGLPVTAEIDVLSVQNIGSYWERSNRFDMALDLTADRRGLAALGDAVTRWLCHLLALDVTVEPLAQMRDVSLCWYVGLEAEGTRIGNVLWKGDKLDDASRSRVLGLYKITFPDPLLVTEKLRGEPVYLIVAMAPDNTLRLKPQNLITGLPLIRREAAR